MDQICDLSFATLNLIDGTIKNYLKHHHTTIIHITVNCFTSPGESSMSHFNFNKFWVEFVAITPSKKP